MFSRLIVSSGTNVLGLYSTREGLVFAEPPGTRHIANINWRAPKSSRDSNIDYFIVKDMSHLPFRPSETRALNGSQTEYDLESKMKFRYRFLDRDVSRVELIRRIATADVKAHIAKKDEGEGLFLPTINGRAPISQTGYSLEGLPMYEGFPTIDFVSRIDSKPLSSSRPARIQIQGKQDFVEDCLLDINLDFAKWCVADITPDGKLAPWNTCSYCYAGHRHNGYPEFWKAEREDIAEQIILAGEERAKLGKLTRYLRLGKNTEAGAPIFRENLINTLEACLDTGIKVIMPTKFLEYDPIVAELFKKTDSTMLVSLGSDELERGTLLYGRGQEARIESGVQYHEEGVRVAGFQIVDPTLEGGGELFRENLKRAIALLPRVQILPLRLRHQEKAKRMYDGWHSIVDDGHEGLFADEDRAYEKGRDGTRLAISLTGVQDLLGKQVGENGKETEVGLCHHSSCISGCSKCFMPGEKHILTVNGKSLIK